MSLRTAPIASWLRVARTIRHLRFSQIAWRLRRVLSVRIPLLPPSSTLALEDGTCFRHVAEQFPVISAPSHDGLSGVELYAELARGELTLVNQTLGFSPHAPDWRVGSQDRHRLWAITLHYHAWLFDLSNQITDEHDLSDAASEVFCSLLQDWLRVCEPGVPGVELLAWNSYAIATRLGWWARLWHSLGRQYWELHPALATNFLRSMYAQAGHLATNIEWDLRANHLLRDAVGLAYAGRFFEGDEATAWLETATVIAVAQADEQLLEDGGHFERSPFYHLEVMDDWMSLALLLRDEQAREKMRKTWQRAAEYARWLSHPDGRVAQLNDGAASQVAPHLAYAKSLSLDHTVAHPRGGRWFMDSGVVAWHGSAWTVFWDVGEIGPDYQPGHAHADTLTFEASYGGHRLFVDPGCYSYDHDERRRYDRSTIAHNTVCIDEQDSSEVWHIFRVGRRARPRDVSVVIDEAGFEGQASHTGFDHLPGRPRHHRVLSVQRDDELSIVDHLTGKGRHMAEGGLLLDPAWKVQPTTDGWRLTQDEITVMVQIEADQPISRDIETRLLHPNYGVELETKRLTWRFSGQFPLTVTVRVRPVSSHCHDGVL